MVNHCATKNAEQWHCTQDNHYSSALPNTDILWQRVSQDSALMSFSQAEAYVTEINQLTLCGRNDWRLPTETELKSLYIDAFAFNMEGFSYRAGYSQSIFNDTLVAEKQLLLDPNRRSLRPGKTKVSLSPSRMNGLRVAADLIPKPIVFDLSLLLALNNEKNNI
ncbi:DUF1566 domain-containing protein [Vibrio sinaloensis]|nr:DUF1566 domain-containing protein [Vibrio sinaloensis]